MPTYQYRCTECGRDLEVVQKFSDASLTECPNCAGTLRKVFNAVGVVFKGSGFYRNDSRAAASGNGSSDSSNGDKKAEKSGDKTETSGDSKPAKTETTKTETKAETSGSKVGSGAGSSSTGGKATSS